MHHMQYAARSVVIAEKQFGSGTFCIEDHCNTSFKSMRFSVSAKFRPNILTIGVSITIIFML